MKILLLNHYGLSPKYHTITRTYNYGKCFVEKGHEVTIITASTVHHTDVNLVEEKQAYRVEEIDGIRYIYVRTPNYEGNGRKRITNMVCYYLAVKKHWKKFGKPDVIMATSVHLLTCVAGIQIAQKAKCKCIVEIADLWPISLVAFGKLKEDSIMAKLLYKLEYWVYKHADEIVFTMEGGKDYIKDKKWDVKIDFNKIHHINNSVVLKQYESEQEEFCLGDKHLDNDNLYKVVYTGSIGDANALEYLVEAAEKVKENNLSDIVFLIWGDGPNRKKFEQYCTDKGLDNVYFKGKVNKKWIPGIVRRGNISVLLGHPYGIYKYGLSMNKIFDYLAAGKPVVSNIVCGYDIFKKYQCGITVEGCEGNTVFDGILKFYEMDDSEYEAWCHRAKIAAKDYDIELLAEKMMTILEK